MSRDDEEASLRGDLRRPVAVDSDSIEWQASPEGSVWRKRFHRVGPAESGQVTSLVRYDPGSRFPPHEHPEGEEILVLDGVFSDEHGDWEAGSYLMSPEGFRHAPFSREGCLLFVKLRQAPGRGRRTVRVRTAEVPWRATETPGVEAKTLHRQEGFCDSVRLERWAAGTEVVTTDPQGLELFVLEGSFTDDLGTHGRHSWLRLPGEVSCRARTATGCLLYVKRGAFPVLRAG